MMEKYYEVFQLVVLIFGFIPSLFIEAMYQLYILLIVFIIVIVHFIRKDYNFKKMIAGGGTIVFSFLSYLCNRSNPGTDDSLGRLKEVVNAVSSASFFAILTIICLITFIVMIAKERKQYALLKNSKNNLPTPQNQPAMESNKNYCTSCGSKIEGNNRFCTNCGKEL